MDYSGTANLFNVGATKNVGQNALAGFAPMAQASNGFQNALQQLTMARMNTQKGLSQSGMDLQNRSLNDYLESQQAGPLDFLGAGLAGYGAVQGIQNRDNYNNYGYVPNRSLPVPQLGGGY